MGKRVSVRLWSDWLMNGPLGRRVNVESLFPLTSCSVLSKVLDTEEVSLFFSLFFFLFMLFFFLSISSVKPPAAAHWRRAEESRAAALAPS